MSDFCKDPGPTSVRAPVYEESLKVLLHFTFFSFLIIMQMFEYFDRVCSLLIGKPQTK